MAIFDKPGKSGSAHRKGKGPDDTCRQRVSAVLESLPDTLFELDEGGQIIEFRQGRKPFPIGDPGAVLGQHYSSLLPEIAAARFKSALERVSREKVQVAFELGLDVDQERRWFELSVSGVNAAHPQASGYIVWAREISHRVRQRRELEESRTQLRTLVSAMADGMVLYSASGRVISCNPSATRILGLSEDQMMGRSAQDPGWAIVHEDGSLMDMDEYPAQRSLTTGQAYRDVVLGVDTPAGTRRWIAVNSQPLFNSDTDATPYAVVVTFSDITARREAEQALRLSEERLALALSGAALGMWDWDLVNNRIELNLGAVRMLGYRPEDVGQGVEAIGALVHPEDRDLVYRALIGHLKGHLRALDAEFRMQRKTGGYIWVKAKGRVTNWSENHRALRACGTLMDISEWKAQERRLRELGNTDPLTGLFNRRYTLARIRDAIDRREPTEAGPSLILFDVDHFKRINDTLGHEAGDQTLQEIARHVRNKLRRSDILSRWGGEEFAILLPATELDEAVTVAESIRKVISEIRFPGVDQVTASFGVVHHRPAETSQSLLARADELQYRAKDAGRNRVCS